MQLNVGNEPTFRCAYMTSINLHFGKVYKHTEVIFGPVQTDGRKAMHMSPPCQVHRWAQKCNLTLAGSPPCDLHM